MFDWVRERSSGITIFLAVVAFVLFSKGVLTLLKFQISVSVLFGLHFIGRIVMNGQSPFSYVKEKWSDGVYGQVQIGSIILLSLALLAQFAALHPEFPDYWSAVMLGVAVASLIIWSMMNIIEARDTLPSIITRESEHK